MVNKYDADTIQRYAGLQGVRKRSSVYMGPNDETGLWVLVREAMDNTLDIATKYKNNKLCHVILDPTKHAYWILDEGPGFPVGLKTFEDEKGKKEKLNTFYAATGLTHTGSNFDSDAASRGVNGVGIKVTNAMAKVFSVWTFRDGTWYAIHYRDARVYKEVTKEKPPKLPHGIKPKKGSIIYVEPDMSLFLPGTKLNLEDLMQWSILSSYLVPSVTIKYTSKKGNTKTFKTGGLADYLTERLTDLKASSAGKPFIIQADLFDIAISFANAESCEVRSYTNGLLNREGGKHTDAVFDALMKSLKPYKGKLEYTSKDIQEGLVGLLNIKLPAPMFSGQTKERLIDERAKKVMGDPVFKAFEEFWKKNKTLAIEVSKRAAELRKVSNSFLQDKKMAKSIEGAKKKLSAKLADVSGSKVPFADRELFLVEGDSAAGGSKRARDKQSQAVLALRGKPLNVMEAPKERIQANEEFTTLFAAMGIDLKSDNPFSKVRYGKIMLFADSDPDGPLGANTKVHLVDGSNPTIKEVHTRRKAGEKMFVWSDVNGNFQPALIEHSTKVKSSDWLKVELDDGTVLRLTKNHRQFIYKNGKPFEVRARNLKVGDSIPCMYVLKRNADRQPSDYHEAGIVKITEMKTTRVFYCLTVPEAGNFYIHDKRGNALLTGNSHITTLLLAMLYRFGKPLLKNGNVYIVNSPIYKARYKGKVLFGFTKEEIYAQTGTTKVDISHLKGLGECNDSDLKYFGMDPKTRKVTKVTMKSASKEFEALMGKDSAARKALMGIL